MQFFLFLFLAIALLVGWTVAVVYMLTKLTPLPSLRARWIYLLSLLSTVSFFIGIIGINTQYSIFSTILYVYGAWWIGILTIAGIISIPLFLLSFFFRGRPTQKIFFGASWSIIILTQIYCLVQTLIPQVVSYDVTLPGEHNWHGAKIVLIADTHYGLIWGENVARGLVEKINALNPKIVLISGDFFDGPAIDYASVAQQFTNITAPDGVLFVNGNHEEYQDTQAMLDALERAHIRVLNNEKEMIDGVTFAGVTYHTTETPEGLRSTLDTLALTPGTPTILLKHKPTLYETLGEYPVSLVVSGHTHHGQMWPISLITDMIFGDYSYGKVVDPTLTAITTSGVGSWGPPQRFGTNSEIVVIHIQ